MLNYIVETQSFFIGKDGKHERAPLRNRILAKSIEQAHEIAEAMGMVEGLESRVKVRLYVHGTGWLYLHADHLQGMLDDLNAAFSEVIHDVRNFHANKRAKVA